MTLFIFAKKYVIITSIIKINIMGEKLPKSNALKTKNKNEKNN